MHRTGNADSSGRVFAEHFARRPDRRPHAAAADHHVPGGQEGAAGQVDVSEIRRATRRRRHHAHRAVSHGEDAPERDILEAKRGRDLGRVTRFKIFRAASHGEDAPVAVW